jgi:hypothetical protein
MAYQLEFLSLVYCVPFSLGVTAYVALGRRKRIKGKRVKGTSTSVLDKLRSCCRAADYSRIDAERDAAQAEAARGEGGRPQEDLFKKAQNDMDPSDLTPRSLKSEIDDAQRTRSAIVNFTRTLTRRARDALAPDALCPRGCATLLTGVPPFRVTGQGERSGSSGRGGGPIE